IVLRFRRGAPEAPGPAEVALRRPRFEDEAPARQIFAAPIRYGEPHAEISYPRAFLDARMTTTDPTLHALLSQQLERALGLPAGEHRVLPRAEADVLAQVRRELHTAIPRGDATVGRVAHALN